MALTRSMAELCDNGDWEALARLQSRRQDVLRQAFSPPPAAASAPLLVPLLRQIQDLDRDILACCESVKSACARELDQLGKGRRAAGAYSEQQGRL